MTVAELFVCIRCLLSCGARQTTLFYGKFVLLVYVPRDDYFATFGQLADAVTTAQKV